MRYYIYKNMVKYLKVIKIIVFVQIMSYVCKHASNVITTNSNTCIVKTLFIAICFKQNNR